MMLRTGAGLAIVIASAVSWASVVQADQIVIQQNVVINGNWQAAGDLDDSDPTRTAGFSVAAGATDLADTEVPALFAAIAADDWITAFRLLETMDETQSEALIRDASGMLRPLSALKVQVLSQMPAQGRRTFRMMNDPIARNLLRDALASTEPQQQLVLLTKLIDNYALCEAAVEAADRLGDLHYELGHFAQAARHYTFATQHAQGDIDDAMLMAKRLHAFARGGDWVQFDDLATYARFRRGDVLLSLGGQDQPLNDIIDELVKARPEDSGLAEQAPVNTIPFPRGAHPIARVTLVEPHFEAQLQQTNGRRGSGLNTTEMVSPRVVAADGRVYTLLMGELSAINPMTGQTLWTQGDADDMAQRVAQRSHELAQGYFQSLNIEGDRLIVTAHDPMQLSTVRLRVHDKATGNVIWNSLDMPGNYANESYIGEPVVNDDTLYAVTMGRAGSNRLNLISIGMRGGEVQWSVDLGQVTSDPNAGHPVGLAPRIAVGERYIMVLTNNGALIAVDPVRQQIAWAMSYRILQSQYNRNTGSATYTGQPGDVAVHEGVVLSKDSRDDRLVAIREHDAAQLWSIRVDPSATLVHTDGQHAYLLGEQLVAIDIHTGERIWWTDHHGNAGQAPAFTDSHALIAGRRRMCRIDLTTGKVDGYREDIPVGSSGSPVVLTDQGVLVISPRAFSIYENPEPEE